MSVLLGFTSSSTKLERVLSCGLFGDSAFHSRCSTDGDCDGGSGRWADLLDGCGEYDLYLTLFPEAVLSVTRCLCELLSDLMHVKSDTLLDMQCAVFDLLADKPGVHAVAE